MIEFLVFEIDFGISYVSETLKALKDLAIFQKNIEVDKKKSENWICPQNCHQK